MKLKAGKVVLSVTALVIWAAPSQAQFAVIDVASLSQLMQQLEADWQQIQLVRQRIAQAEQLYASMTGSRGMQQLLGSQVRNYLPGDWNSLSTVVQNGSTAWTTLGNDIQRFQQQNAVLNAGQVAALSPNGRQSLVAQRQNVALLQGLASQALANSSARFASLQTLIDAIPGATDEKAMLELQARIAAEQSMLQNEQTKLQVLRHAVDGANQGVELQTRERIVAAHGNFATRFHPSME